MPDIPLPYRLLFLDLDGTLIDHEDRLSPRTIDALEAARQAGCVVVVCTARNRYMVEHVAAQWREETHTGGRRYAIFSNGAVIADWDSGEILEKLPVDPATVRRAASLAYRCNLAPLCFGVHVEEDGGRRVHTDRRHSLPASYVEWNAARLVYCEPDIETGPDLSPVGMGAYGDEDSTRILADLWNTELTSDIISFHMPDWKYKTWCAFLNLRIADKADAARRVAEMLGIPREQTIAIGDHVNDLGMLRWAGLGICMGDGHAEARAAADVVTSTLAEDGAAQAIERFVLGVERISS